MARSFSNTKFLCAFIIKALNKRGFSTAATPHHKEELPREGHMVPDPRTECYRPENVVEEIDAPEVRAMQLKKH
uniref:Uncharacterized protein n=1 Tax=Manihot esculenta TaxID=3983 RepID=A0A2C9VVY1_MANES